MIWLYKTLSFLYQNLIIIIIIIIIISTMNIFKQLNQALEFAEFVKSQKFKSQKIVSLPACLYTLIDLPPKLLGI